MEWRGKRKRKTRSKVQEWGSGGGGGGGGNHGWAVVVAGGRRGGTCGVAGGICLLERIAGTVAYRHREEDKKIRGQVP